ncbi:MAG: 2,3-bisphosphoglycerate-independent phosphoglycerate mutase [Deltaproteobacteria bacterium]|nr:2,3-bisphosphoglycerate-independent phosphoglycerate mutase [Deltaproteobacteria bacterium]
MSTLHLQPHPHTEAISGPVTLVVMDGVGIGSGDLSDAVAAARTPNLDALAKRALVTQLRAHGKAVGLPSDGDMGNSEVGHNALGAGRVFDQGAKRVNQAIATGDLFEGAEWKRLVARVAESGEPLHFLGLLSDGNVHSHIDHLLAMLRRAHADGVKRVRVHALLDGRDVPETSALQYVAQLEAVLSELRGAGADYRVASGGGRMHITMDRYEADWAMVERGWQTHVRAEARKFASLEEAIVTLGEEDASITDQHLPAFVIADSDGAPVGPIRDGAAVVFFNFRGDRAIEISRAFDEQDFTAFERGPRLDVAYAGIMQYDGDLQIPRHFLVDPPAIDRTFGEYLVYAGKRIFACAETQKFGHVTYFWNGNRSGHFSDALEKYVEVPSDLAPFEQRPWMKAAEVADATVAAIASGDFDLVRVNFANGDMVGHTGDLEAAILAVEAVDLCVGRLVEATERAGGAIVVTADHGNADEMIEHDKKTGAMKKKGGGAWQRKTSHTLNAVPCYLWAADRELELADLTQPGLANVAATALMLMGYAAPEGYEPSLLKA